jgi:hypothetical protein
MPAKRGVRVRQTHGSETRQPALSVVRSSHGWSTMRSRTSGGREHDTVVSTRGFPLMLMRLAAYQARWKTFWQSGPGWWAPRGSHSKHRSRCKHDVICWLPRVCLGRWPSGLCGGIDSRYIGKRSAEPRARDVETGSHAHAPFTAWTSGAGG